MLWRQKPIRSAGEATKVRGLCAPSWSKTAPQYLWNVHGRPCRSTGCDSRVAGSLGRAGKGERWGREESGSVFLCARELREQLENSGLKRNKLENPSFDAALQSAPNKQEGTSLQRCAIRQTPSLSDSFSAVAALRRPGGEPPGRGRLSGRGESGGGEGDGGLV